MLYIYKRTYQKVKVFYLEVKMIIFHIRLFLNFISNAYQILKFLSCKDKATQQT